MKPLTMFPGSGRSGDARVTDRLEQLSGTCGYGRPAFHLSSVATSWARA